MLEMRGRRQAIGSGKAAEAIGIEALTFLAEERELMQRFLDLSGMEVGQLRAAAARPALFIGLLDFILAHEPTLLDFAGKAGLDPAEVGVARIALAKAGKAA